MTKPESFIINSDYATLKNDATTTLSVTIPNSLSLAGVSIYTLTDTVTIGQRGSSIRSRIHSTMRDQWFVANQVTYSYMSGATHPLWGDLNYDIYVTVNRTSSTQLSLIVTILNGYDEPITINGAGQTITAKVATFLPPYA